MLKMRGPRHGLEEQTHLANRHTQKGKNTPIPSGWAPPPPPSPFPSGPFQSSAAPCVCFSFSRETERGQDLGGEWRRPCGLCAEAGTCCTARLALCKDCSRIKPAPEEPRK